MKLVEIRAIAAQQGIKSGKMNKGELIRTIQTAEGNEACFGSGLAVACGQAQCLWRDDCE